jgi:hypothetical protein
MFNPQTERIDATFCGGNFMNNKFTSQQRLEKFKFYKIFMLAPLDPESLVKDVCI